MISGGDAWLGLYRLARVYWVAGTIAALAIIVIVHVLVRPRSETYTVERISSDCKALFPAESQFNALARCINERVEAMRAARGTQ